MFGLHPDGSEQPARRVAAMAFPSRLQQSHVVTSLKC
jgi:hypothetical protein